MELEWIDARLREAGISRIGDFGEPRVRPWSTVVSAPTSAGTVWFKATNEANAFEAGLYGLLRELAPDAVLEPIAVDVGRGWLLLPHGDAVGWEVSDDELTSAFVEALPRYGQLQRDLAPHVEQMLDVGVADMRPAIMPARFGEALAVAGELPEVAARADDFAAWCARLAESPIAGSLDHNDLHPANILRDGRYYDWGDAVVAHPFAAMFVPLRVLADRLGSRAEGVLRVRDAYLEVFTDLAPRGELVAELDLACRVAKVARALVWARSIAPAPGEWADAPREALLSLLVKSHY